MIAVALLQLRATTDTLTITNTTVGAIPVTVYKGNGPAVVIAHGFAGSRQLMEPYAATLARAGYTAITFDFPGHGRNPHPLTGDLAVVEGATRSLVAATQQVVAYAKTIAPGPVAVLGHSMASDIIVRTAIADPEIAATIGVSMFSPAVTAEAPRNLLLIVGEWETMLTAEAERAASLDPASRRAVIVPNAEHVSILFRQAGMKAALDWMDKVFNRPTPPAPYLDSRGPAILSLLAGIVALAGPLASLLPAGPAIGADLPWRRLWWRIALPALATPLILRLLPTHFLPVVVGDYLAVHFGLYGLLTILCLGRMPPIRLRSLAISLPIVAYTVGLLAWALDSWVTAFLPTAARLPLLAAMLAGTLPYFLATEFLTRGPNAARLGYAASKLAFLLSLTLAVALDFQRLFFLALIVPVILLFFLVYGTFSAWSCRRTGDPAAAAIASAIGFALAIGTTFPQIAG